MSSNKKLLKDFEDLAVLKVRRRALQALEAKTRRELSEVEDRIYEAEQVSKVLDGIAVSVKTNNNGKWVTLQTVASGQRTRRREAKMYQRVDTPHWAVSVNSYGNGEQQFRGGRVIGLRDDLKKKEAQDLAERWIKGDESVLNYRRAGK